MTDNTITSGTVFIEDGVKAKEEYAPARKASVTLNFAVPEGAAAQAYLDATATMARDKVTELLGRAATAKIVPPASAATPLAAAPSSAPKGAEIPKIPETPAKPTTRKKNDAPAGEKTKADLEKEMLANAGKTPETPMIEDEDPLSDLLGDTAPIPVTDKELSAAAIAKADKMKAVSGWDAKKIRLLVEKFAGKAGSKFHEVPADKRHDFLKELDALK